MLTARHGLMFRLLAVVLIWRLLTILGSPAAAAALPQEASALGEMVRLPGHVLPALNGATPVAPTPGAEDDPLTLTVVLKRTDQAGFDRYVRDVYDPASPHFRHFLSQDEIAARFGPTQGAYEDVLAYLQQKGFTLVQGSANRLTLTVRGTRAQAESAFQVGIGYYSLGSRTFYANDQNPVLPIAIADKVAAVSGLSNLARPAGPNDNALPNGTTGNLCPGVGVPALLATLANPETALALLPIPLSFCTGWYLGTLYRLWLTDLFTVIFDFFLGPFLHQALTRSSISGLPPKMSRATLSLAFRTTLSLFE